MPLLQQIANLLKKISLVETLYPTTYKLNQKIC